MKLRSGLIAKVLVAVLAVSMILSGCGSEKTNVDTATGTTVKNESTVKEEAPKKDVTLQMYGWTDSGIAIDEVINRFTAKNPEIKVNFSGVSTKEWQTAQKTKLLSGDGSIDIIWSHPGYEFDVIAKSGFLTDLTGSGWIPNIQEGALKASTYDGKIYGIPYTQNMLGVFYNKKIFADLGLKVPTTWSEMIDTCEKINAKNIAPFALALGDWPKLFMVYGLHTSMIMSKNANWFEDRTAGKASFIDYAPVLDRYVEIIQKYAAEGPKGALGVKYDTHLQMLVSGKAAMVFQGTWAINDMKKLDANVDVGMFPINGLDDASGLVIPQGVGTNYSVVSSSKNVEEAKKFIEFLSTSDAYLDGAIPVMKGATGAPDYLKEHMLPVADQGKTAEFMDVSWPAGFGDKFGKDADAIITLTVKPADAVKNFDKYWDDAVKKANDNK